MIYTPPTTTEIVVNIHMHTRYSDGTGTHEDIAAAALRCGLDAVIVTDHNVLVRRVEGYAGSGKHKVLMLVGEEVHDQDREPQKNHLLVLGLDHEAATLADDPATLIRATREAGGLSFIAHPRDPAAPAFGEHDISWEDWSVTGYTGIELWNGLSELKTLIPTKLHGALYAFCPSLVAHGPMPFTVQKWDELMRRDRVVAIGGSDAHALHLHMGPVHRVIYPYDFHFHAINTHTLIPRELSGEVETDRRLVYEALAAGHCFVGYDLPLSTQGFRFIGTGRAASVIMGDEIPARGGVTLQAHVPAEAEIRLVHNGIVIRKMKRAYALTHIAEEPGAYRIEVYRRYRGLRRGWIFSNPIYVR
ncbi:MAG TPA: CehA/McbA family metallohydrolase [Anaerolineales bacterium]|nr:CehA/McbA family metallohydrolase [Anaerolineales bacterium]